MGPAKNRAARIPATRLYLCIRRRGKTPSIVERYWCLRQMKKKTNRVSGWLGQPARHPTALRCDGPCRRTTYIYGPRHARGLGGYNHCCTAEEVEWRPLLLKTYSLDHRLSAKLDSTAPLNPPPPPWQLAPPPAAKGLLPTSTAGESRRKARDRPPRVLPLPRAHCAILCTTTTFPLTIW